MDEVPETPDNPNVPQKRQESGQPTKSYLYLGNPSGLKIELAGRMVEFTKGATVDLTEKELQAFNASPYNRSNLQEVIL